METNADVQDFCRRYFTAVDAPVLVDQPDFLQVELPREIDKELTDRPYYWMYVEATGQDVPNSVLSLSFQPDLQVEGVEKIEFVTLGSFRLNKLIESAQKRGRFVQVYQQSGVLTGGTLTPWLLSTFKISFVADRRRDEMVSYAVNLHDGRVLRDFYEQVADVAFADQPPAHVQTRPAALTEPIAYQRLREQVEADLRALDHTWALDAEYHLEREMEQLETYYQSLGLVNDDTAHTDDEKAKKAALYAAERELRLAELKWRCAPRITVAPFHFARIYCADGLLTRTAETPKRLSM